MKQKVIQGIIISITILVGISPFLLKGTPDWLKNDISKKETKFETIIEVSENETTYYTVVEYWELQGNNYDVVYEDSKGNIYRKDLRIKNVPVDMSYIIMDTNGNVINCGN